MSGIQCGSIVITVSGFVGRVYKIANNRVYLSQVYQMAKSKNYIDAGRARAYAFEYEIEKVVRQ